MEYRLVNELNEPHTLDLLSLYQEEWWSRGRTLEDVRTMLRHTGLIFGFVDTASDKLVAFARALTDRVYKAIIFDVIVHRDHRKAGLGRQILDTIVEHPLLSRVQMIELYCLPELIPFYQQWGFTTDLAGCVFMRRLPQTGRPILPNRQ